MSYMRKKSLIKWYPIPDFEGYYKINRLGTIRSVSRFVSIRSHRRHYKQQYIQSRINNFGYRTVTLCRGGHCKTLFVHVILAKVFIPNQYSLPEVNHKNGKKLDNELENLEWVTHSQNMIHAYANGLIAKKGKAVIDNCSGKEFRNAKEAALFSQLKYNTLRNYLNRNIRKNPTCLEYKLAA
ncbi:MAG: hypothetical protein EOO08_12160 [Chitinophagaceae bacterium]|nr:MAG: hypothetical protein EOO08_12160 [Chitinophagaceae bacterium]